MLAMGREHRMKVHAMMLANEMCWRTEAEIRSRLLHLWSVMQACVQRACRASGTLPGGLRVVRRAPKLYAELQQREGPTDDHLTVLDRQRRARRHHVACGFARGLVEQGQIAVGEAADVAALVAQEVHAAPQVRLDALQVGGALVVVAAGPVLPRPDEADAAPRPHAHAVAALPSWSQVPTEQGREGALLPAQ